MGCPSWCWFFMQQICLTWGDKDRSCILAYFNCMQLQIWIEWLCVITMKAAVLMHMNCIVLSSFSHQWAFIQNHILDWFEHVTELYVYIIKDALCLALWMEEHYFVTKWRNYRSTGLLCGTGWRSWMFEMHCVIKKFLVGTSDDATSMNYRLK